MVTRRPEQHASKMPAAGLRDPADRQAVRRAIDTSYSGAFAAVMLTSAALSWSAALLAFYALPRALPLAQSRAGRS